MFELFNDAARRVIVVAQEQCRHVGPGHIGTEHLLLALSADTDGPVGRTLHTLGLTTAGLTERAVAITGTPESPVEGHVPFTVRAKQALEGSRDEAATVGSDLIRPEHLLLALIEDPECTASLLIREQVGPLERVSDALRREMGPSSNQPATDQPPTPADTPAQCRHPPRELWWEPIEIDGHTGPIVARIVVCQLCATTVGVVDGAG